MSEAAIRPAKIVRVLPGSIAEELEIQAGDRLVAINDQRPRDLIDYNFLCADEVLELALLDGRSQPYTIALEKDADADLGLEFEAALFDGPMQCNNRCPFCFIDQQPPGKRETLYVKDDDYRLSFLYGSYLTLTNLSDREWERIEFLRLSPLYVSVHATDPAVRVRLLKNPRAGQILEQLAWFRDRRLQIHAQVVVCPGINDGDCLERTIRDLAGFYVAGWQRPAPAEWGEVDEPALEPALAGRSWAIADSVALPTPELAPASQVALVGSPTFADAPLNAVIESADEWEGFNGPLDASLAAELEAELDALGNSLAPSSPGHGRPELAADPASWWGPDDSFETAAPPVPTVTSVAIVPVGLTQFRPAEDDLEPVTAVTAAAVIDQVQALQQEFRQSLGSTFVWLADEWFLLAGRDLPPSEEYEDFPQIDNGVGSIRLFVDRFLAAVAQALPSPITQAPPPPAPKPRTYVWVVGNAVEAAFAPLVDRLNQLPGLTVRLAALRSIYWGQTLSVTGLLTGSDLIGHLIDQDLGDGLLIPSVMLKAGETGPTARFLDDLTLGQVCERLATRAIVTTSPEDVVAKLLRDESSGGVFADVKSFDVPLT